jgi:hypothetical protein
VKQKKNGCVRITKNSGNHVAQLKESYNIKGLLPAPLMSTQKNYCFKRLQQNAVPIYLSLYDYNNSNFFSGNKRKIKRFRFISGGYRYQDGLHYYLTNENFVRKPILIARNNCTALI